MAYQKTFTAQTAQEAVALAQEFKSTLHFMQQPSLSGVAERKSLAGEPEFSVTVNYFGFD